MVGSKISRLRKFNVVKIQRILSNILSQTGEPKVNKLYKIGHGYWISLKMRKMVRKLNTTIHRDTLQSELLSISMVKVCQKTILPDDFRNF